MDDPVLSKSRMGFIADYTKWTGSPAGPKEWELDPKESRQLKRMWNQHADHAFMQTIVTVHWIHGVTDEQVVDGLRGILSASNRDEVATTGYLPGRRLRKTFMSELGVGLWIRGRVTYASSDMDSVWSGSYTGDRYRTTGHSHDRTSGFVKRPTVNMPAESVVILDGLDAGRIASSGGPDSPVNEFIVDNWRPEAVIVLRRYRTNKLLDQVHELVDHRGLRILNGDRRETIETKRTV